MCYTWVGPSRYAGWIGTIAAKSFSDKSTERLKLEESSHRLAACAGTSTCHIVQVSRVGRTEIQGYEVKCRADSEVAVIASRSER
jgi:hypothetical protein